MAPFANRIVAILSIAFSLLAENAPAWSQGQQPVPPKRVALLVGVNRYQKPGLSNLRFAERDVQQVAEELKKQGFVTKLLLGSGEGNDQATRENILSSARAMVKKLGKEDLALVMLSGHGQQVQQTGADGKVREDAYFVPVEGVAGRPSTLVSLSELTDDILANDVGRKLLLVDACRDVSKAAGRGAKGIQGKVIALPEDTAVFFACRAGQQSFEDGTLQHGLFTYCLLEGLRGKAARDSEFSWSDLISHIQRRMESAEIRKYMPEDESQNPIAAGGVQHTVLAKFKASGRPGKIDVYDYLDKIAKASARLDKAADGLVRAAGNSPEPGEKERLAIKRSMQDLNQLVAKLQQEARGYKVPNHPLGAEVKRIYDRFLSFEAGSFKKFLEVMEDINLTPEAQMEELGKLEESLGPQEDEISKQMEEAIDKLREAAE